MYRDDLITAVRRAAEGLGYTFTSGSETAVAERLERLPAAWLHPLKLSGIKGRNEAYISYKAALMLMAVQRQDKIQEDVWRKLEYDAMAICRALEENEHILYIRNLRCVPGTMPLTRNGEAGITAEFDVEMFYVV